MPCGVEIYCIISFEGEDYWRGRGGRRSSRWRIQREPKPRIHRKPGGKIKDREDTFL